MSLNSLVEAHTWAVDLVDRVGQAQGWTQSGIDAGQDYVEQALDAAWSDLNYSPIPDLSLPAIELAKAAGIDVDQGEAFFAYLAGYWPVRSGFPESWNNLDSIWLEAQETAKSASDFDDRWFEALGWFVEETVKETAEVVIDATKRASLGAGAILAIAGLVYVVTR